jgi:hypothetical protein
MPLSREGTLLRIAVPKLNQEFVNNAGAKCVRDIFEMDVVLIPFGSMLVRSKCLIHSGFYDSPGNTRFCATLQSKNRTLSEKILPFSEIIKHNDFGQWTLQWSKEVHTHYQSANNLYSLTNKDMAQKRKDNKRCWKEFIQYDFDQLNTLVLMTNPSEEREFDRIEIKKYTEADVEGITASNSNVEDERKPAAKQTNVGHPRKSGRKGTQSHAQEGNEDERGRTLQQSGNKPRRSARKRTRSQK